MASGEVVGVDAAVGPGPRLGRVEYHIAAGQELVQSVALWILAQIECDAELAGIAGREKQGMTTGHGMHRAGRRPLGRFNPQHLRAEVTQESTGEFTSLDREVDNTDSR